MMSGLKMISEVFDVCVFVLLFWTNKLRDWFNSEKPVEFWAHNLQNAQTFEDWHIAAKTLDRLLDLDIWREQGVSVLYDCRLITHCLTSMMVHHADHDIPHLIYAIRLCLLRNLGNITAPKLYNHAFSGTKVLIEEFNKQLELSIHYIRTLPVALSDESGSASNGDNPGVRTQTKMNVIHDMRQAYGRSTLVLQGGAIFGLYHLGVIRALFLRGLLPRIITGTATGALIAALVCVHTEEELPAVLRGDGIDLSAFSKGDETGHGQPWRSLLMTLGRRLWRYVREGYFLDIGVLEECVRANVGELTFEEAYNRTKRVLNITVATCDDAGIPTLLNHVTAPHVLIWTAAVASNAHTAAFYGHRETLVLCKDADGNIVPWAPGTSTKFRHWTHVSYAGRESPLHRAAELFNVNHFIVSQARPYLAPFLQSDMHGPSIMVKGGVISRAASFMFYQLGLEVQHRMRQLDAFGILPVRMQRFIFDEQIPGQFMLLVPELSASDFARLLETPTRDTLEYWILKGERTVWPAVAALRVRLGVETELDRSYQVVRRFKAGKLRRRASLADALTGTSVDQDDDN